MGASESKLVFKQGIFKLQEARPIPADDAYWTGFWQLPESTEDVFTLFSAADIRRTRDASLENLETLILALTSRLFFLTKHQQFPHPEAAPAREALNCIRVLTRILPYIYETDNLDAWDERFFWAARRTRKKRRGKAEEVLFDETAQEPQQQQQQQQQQEKDATAERGADDDDFEETKPLAEELIDTLIDLLFFTDFTIARNERTKAKVSYSIWSSGVGCNTPVASNSQLESNRTEVLRLLLTLASKSLYIPANVLPLKGVRAITYMATCSEKQIVLSMLCSFLNTTLKFNPASWRIPYDHVVVGDPKHLYIASSLQFLLVLLLYPVPEESSRPAGSKQKNYFRHFLGRIHRAEDFQFICDGLSRTLHQPLAATSSYLPGSHKPVRWASEMIMLFWELIQCNKRFRSFVVDTERGHDFLILILFYAMEYRTDPTRQGIVRMCVFILQTLSVESGFGKGLNQAFLRQETLPPALRIERWSGTYGDFLIVSLYTLITGSKGRLDAVYPALLAILNNVAPYLENVNRLSCYKIVQLYVRMSSPSFLLANETNYQLLVALLEAINAIIEYKYKENEELVANILKHRRRFEALRSFTLESAQEEMERVTRRRKEAGAHDLESASVASSRRESVDSLRTPITPRTPRMGSIASALPDESTTFTIGEDSDEDEDSPAAATTATGGRRASSRASQSSQSAAAAMEQSAEDAVPAQLRGMSEKARGKMPANRPTFARVNSVSSVSSIPGSPGLLARSPSSSSLLSPGLATPSLGTGGFPNNFTPSSSWLDAWLPTLPLHTILTLIQHTATHQPQAPNQPPPSLPPGIIDPDPIVLTSTSTSNPTTSSFSSASATARTHSNSTGANTNTHPSSPSSSSLNAAHAHAAPAHSAHTPDSPPLSSRRVHLFEWTTLSLGWYESLLWTFIVSFSAETPSSNLNFNLNLNFNPTNTNSSGSIGSGGNNAVVGVWNGTAIRLFRLEAPKRGDGGPSLLAPRGAIDAVGNGIVQRLGGLGLGGVGGGGSNSNGSNGGGGGGGAGAGAGGSSSGNTPGNGL